MILTDLAGAECTSSVIDREDQESTLAKKLMMFPSGSRNQTERLPQVWVVGGLTKTTSSAFSRSNSLSTSSTSNSSVYRPHPESWSEPGAIRSMPSSVKIDKAAP